MARQTTRKDLTRLFKQLDEDDRERVLDYARRLADGSGTSDGPRKSLAKGSNGPSYLAAADENRYEHLKEEYENNRRPTDMAP